MNAFSAGPHKLGEAGFEPGEFELPADPYTAALWWFARGYNVVPQKRGGVKYPAVEWKDLQDRRVTEVELCRWRPMFANGVGFVTGAVSDAVVIETDGQEGEALLAEFEELHGPLPETLTIRSGSGRGLHRHFKHPGYRVKTKANPSIKIDVKADGGFAVLPPSLHKSGGRYAIVRSARELAELPEGLLGFIEKKAAQTRCGGGEESASGRATAMRAMNGEPSPLMLRMVGGIAPEPPGVETMAAMLRHLARQNCFEPRGGVSKDAGGRIVKVGWRECGMALRTAYGDGVGPDLWALTHIDERARADAPGQWKSFASTVRPGDVTIATLIQAAKDAGFSFAATPEQAESQSPEDRRLAELAALSPVGYDRIRDKAAKEIGIRVATLDKEVEKRRPKTETEDEGKTGRALKLAALQPWPEPVDGAKLIAELVDQIRRFVMLTREAAIAVALWIAHAHVFEAFSISPRLAVISPEKRCGKTTLLRVIQALVPKPLSAVNITPAATFRTVEAFRPTLLIDEADAFLGDNEELRGVLNSGHERDGQVVRLVGDDFEPRAFSTFCPVAIALIGRLPATLEDRSVVVSMRRRLRSELVERFRSDRVEHLHEHARKIARFVEDHKDVLRDADPGMPEGLHDRACDNWRPLLAIADCAGGDWGRRAREAALTLSGQEDADEQSRGVMLLADIQRVFAEKKTDRISSTDLVSALADLPDRPWGAWAKGKPISTARVARLLRPFGITPSTVRIGEKTPNGYQLSQFEDAFDRYLPNPPHPAPKVPTVPTTQENRAFPGNSKFPQGAACGNFENRAILRETRRVGTVGTLRPLIQGFDGAMGVDGAGKIENGGFSDFRENDFFENDDGSKFHRQLETVTPSFGISENGFSAGGRVMAMRVGPEAERRWREKRRRAKMKRLFPRLEVGPLGAVSRM